MPESLQISMFSPLPPQSATVYDIATKSPVKKEKEKKTLVIPAINPISPSGTFTPGEEDLTRDGRTKATPGDSLRSYNDYERICNYFLSTNSLYGVRNAALFAIGIATGLRISDLVSLKVGHLLTVDETGNTVFKEKIDINEKKTGKRTVNLNDSVLITEAVQQAVSLLLQAYAQTSSRTKTPKTLNFDDFLFKSKSPIRSQYTKDKKGNQIVNPLFGEYVLTEESAFRVFKTAQRDLALDFCLCTRTTRKTFASLHLMFSRSLSTGNGAGIELTQLSLRHSSPTKTMHYLGITRSHSTAVREMISDWIMGKSEYEKITL